MRFSNAIFLFIFTACAITQNKNTVQQLATLPQSQLNPMLVGRWKGIRKEKSKIRSWYMDRYDNGVFHMTNYSGGNLDGEEFGVWFADSKKYSTMTLGFIEGKELLADMISETYDIQKISSELLIYKNPKTRNVFRVKKVTGLEGIPPSEHFSKTSPKSENFDKAQLLMVDLLKKLETKQFAQAYNLFCNDQLPTKEVFIQSLEAIEKGYGNPKKPHFIKKALVGARASATKVHPTFSFWIRSQFEKPNTFIRADISYFDREKVCVLSYAPVNFANDNIPPELR